MGDSVNVVRVDPEGGLSLRDSALLHQVLATAAQYWAEMGESRVAEQYRQLCTALESHQFRALDRSEPDEWVLTHGMDVTDTVSPLLQDALANADSDYRRSGCSELADRCQVLAFTLSLALIVLVYPDAT